MKVLALGSRSQPISPEQRDQVMPREVPSTLQLYLDGTIEQFWYRQDQPGVVFLMDVESVEKAKEALTTQPLVAEGFAKYDVVPVGPLIPLCLLIEGQPACAA
jgi:hypothetical protein